jgi:hypothetical protein
MTADLNDFFLPGQPLPSDTVMIAKALEVLEQSPHGQQLTNFVEKKEITITIIAVPEPVTYLPEKKLVYIGFNRNKPISPSRFILMLAGILREAQQEAGGFKHPPLSAPLAEHEKTSMAKQEDKVWYMCAVATELNTLESFKKFNFIEELRIMGYTEALDLYAKQQGK